MELTPNNVANFQRQLERAGLMVDWRSKVDTSRPDYYKWTQWVFLQLYKQGLAYKKAAAVNWCPTDKTVLANEQVEDGLCERCGTRRRAARARAVVLPHLRLRRAPAEQPRLARLVGDHQAGAAQLDRPVARARSCASRVAGTRRSADVAVFTTRADTIFGATYLVLAPEHPLVRRVTTDAQRGAVQRVPGCAHASRTSCRARATQGQDRRVHRRVRRQSGHRRERSRSGSPTTC